MSLLTITLLGLALAMDAFAVSLSAGVTMCRMHLRHAVRMAAFFGGFQAFMPIAGWCIGRVAANLVRSFDHWVAFLLLTFVGVKMIHEAIRYKADGEDKKNDYHSVKILLALAFATSIDAAAVGITLSFLKVAIVFPALVIGIVTFFVSLAGTAIGCKAGDFFGGRIEVLGGVVLIGIGVKILVEHLFF